VLSEVTIVLVLLVWCGFCALCCRYVNEVVMNINPVHNLAVFW